MRIGELARLAGVAPSRIRFYEKRGLLPPAVRLSNGYRDYTEYAVTRVKTIVTCQQLGFSLADIRAALPKALEEEMPAAVAVHHLRRKIAEVDAQIALLKTQRNRLQATLKDELRHVN